MGRFYGCNDKNLDKFHQLIPIFECVTIAQTHTNISIRDAILSVNFPFYEVHISNVFAREEFRHTSFFSDIAKGCIVGFGFDGYEFALTKIMRGGNGS